MSVNYIKISTFYEKAMHEQGISEYRCLKQFLFHLLGHYFISGIFLNIYFNKTMSIIQKLDAVGT